MSHRASRRARRIAFMLVALAIAVSVTPASAAWAKTGTKLSLSTSSKTPAYAAQVRLTATLKTSSGKVIKNTTVTIQRWDGSAWVKVASGKTSSTGKYSTRKTPHNHALTLYRARYTGSSKYKASTSATITVKPRVYLSRPKGPAEWTVGDLFDVSGLLKPAHTAGSAAVVVRRYWGDSQSGPWTFSAEFPSVVSAATEGSTYKASVLIPDGSHRYWRFIAYHAPDELHAATTSSGTIYLVGD